MIGYLRVSTEEQANSGLGIEAQREAIQRYAHQQGWTVVWYEDAGRSGANLDRPALQEALARLHPKKRDVEGLVVAKMDRLSRSVADFARLLELAQKRRWSVVAIDLGVDTTTAAGELVANVMMSVAQWERRVIGERTSAALQTLKRQGVKLGRPVTLPPASEKRLLELRREGLSFAATADTLNAEGIPTAMGGVWHTSTVSKTLARLARAADAETSTDPTKEPHAAPAA